MTNRPGRVEAATGVLRVGILGPFAWAGADGWQAAPTRQVGRIATVLAGWPGQVVERARIIEAVWGAAPPATAVNTLQVHVSQLRRFIGPETVELVAHDYRLAVDPGEVDAEYFSARLRDATAARRHGDDVTAAIVLAEVLDLWRGTPYPDVDDADLAARRASLQELADQAREQLIDCRLTLAADRYDLDAVVAQARELVARHPERDRGHDVLVRALEASGRAQEAATAREAARAMGVTVGGTE